MEATCNILVSQSKAHSAWLMQEYQRPAPAQKHLADPNRTMTVRLKLLEPIEQPHILCEFRAAPRHSRQMRNH